MQYILYGLVSEVSVSTDMANRFALTINPCGGDHGTVEISSGTKSVFLSVIVPTGMPVIGYAMHYGQNNHEIDQVSDSREGSRRFTKEVKLNWEKANGGVQTAPQPPTDGGQSLRLLSVDNTGRLHDLVISFVKQDEQLFVTVQETYNEQLYRAGDLVVCPPMEKTRLATLEMVRQMLEGNAEFVATLPEKSIFQRPDFKKQALTLREGEGLVLWFADGMNSGAVLVKDGSGARQYKVHFSEILTVRQGRRFLRTGERVLFRGTKPIPGKSQFRAQLTDVTVEGVFPGLVKLEFPKAEDFQIS